MKGLARLSGLSVGLRVARTLLGIGSSVLLARLLTVEEYGIFAYALVIATLLAIPGEAGMPNLVLREVARARADSDPSRVRGVAAFASITVLTLTLAMMVILLAILWVAGDAVSPLLRWTLLAALPALLFGVLANTRSGIQRALDEPIAAQIPEQLVRPAGVILFSLLLWAATDRLDPTEAMIGYSLASGVSLIVGSVMLHRAWRRAIGSGPATFRTRTWLGALPSFSLAAGLQIALVQVSALVLGLVAAPGEIAAFRVATVTSDTALFALFAINALVAPQFATHFHRGETDALQQLVARANRLNIAFALAVTLGLVALGPWGLALVFGEPYRAAYLPMVILAAGHLAGATVGFVATLANMAGRERMTLAGAVFGVALNAGLSALLCPRYGATGAAVSAAVTAAAWRFVLAVPLYRKLGVRAWAVAGDFGPLLARLVRRGE